MNAWWQAFHFLRPHWLWALLALPALWGMWRLRQQRGNVWKETVDPHLLPHLLERGGGATARHGPWLGALGLIVAVLALAGPSWRQSEQPLLQSHAPLVIAVDLSTAIAASDLPPSRLLQVRAKLATLLRERQGGQVALVAYAGEAFTVAPLTDDAGNVALFLDALEPDVMPVDGQRADQAIAAAVRLMQQAGFDHGQILLLSDHADAAANAAAAEARSKGYRVSALGVGTAAGAPYRDAQGTIARARLDASSLQALASAGGGGYETLAAGQEDLQALGVLEPADAEASVARGQKGLAWQDQGYWLLPLLMLLALFAFRRGAGFAVVLVCLSLPLALPAQAQESGWWQRADQQAHQRLEQGAEAYRKGDFAAAEQAFTGLDSADGWYNQGNTLAKQGRYDEAIAAYDQALKRRPNMEDALANRKAVDAARKRKPPQGGQQQKPQQSNDQQQGKQKQDQSGQGQSQPQDQPGQKPQDQSQGDQAKQEQQGQQEQGQQEQGKQGQDQQGAAQQSPRPQPGKQPGESPGQARGSQSEQQQAEDAKAQQAADAAQRERMQQAMAQAAAQGKAQEQAGTSAAQVTESAEQREQRQAVEAWLRRVPDDPGGLLKNKFRLEYERRQKEGR